MLTWVYPYLLLTLNASLPDSRYSTDISQDNAMEEIKTFNEQRAEIYWWLSGVFAKTLTKHDLDTYHTVPVRSFLTGMGANTGLKHAIEQLINALNRIRNRSDALSALASNYMQLFNASDKPAAPPYASAYIDTTDSPENAPAQLMSEIMQQRGITSPDSNNGPADHIALELDILANMIIRSNELEKPGHIQQALLEQKQFIQQHLLTWLPSFRDNCIRHDTSGFYAALAMLLVDFCQLDCDYLGNE